jgi:cold shock CspA family protein
LVRGRVDWYGANQGHGFIIPEDGGTKAFVRRKDIKPDEKNLENKTKCPTRRSRAPRDRRRGTYLGRNFRPPAVSLARAEKTSGS